jgi:hypothetical protein
MGCNQSSARTGPGESAPSTAKKANIEKKKADVLEDEAKKRRSQQGKVENMVHEEFERGW